ncbi:Protein of unknown function [Bacillus mycoides]|uniref:Uncharacterized protein n=1 Tax=Bacillus mycoides TaxID=1405 RepID=A0A1G4ETQ7_BACMY|nr:Protein of unknown function [Bacillus mycoides]
MQPEGFFYRKKRTISGWAQSAAE